MPTTNKRAKKVNTKITPNALKLIAGLAFGSSGVNRDETATQVIKALRRNFHLFITLKPNAQITSYK